MSFLLMCNYGVSTHDCSDNIDEWVKHIAPMNIKPFENKSTQPLDLYPGTTIAILRLHIGQSLVHSELW